MEQDKFMQYGRGLGLWRNPREDIKADPVSHFRDDPVYFDPPKKGYWVDGPPSYLTGEKKDAGFTPDYPKSKVTYLSEPVSIAVLSVDEAAEFLNNLYNEYANKDTISEGKSYKDLYKGLKGAFDTAKGLGGLGVSSRIKNINGVDWIIIKNYRRHAQTLMKGNKWLASNPKVIQAGIGLTSVKGAIKYVSVNPGFEVAFAIGSNAVDLILRDEATLVEFGVNSAGDMAKGFIASGLAAGVAVVFSGGSVLVAGALFAAASFFISKGLDSADEEFGISEKLTKEFEKLLG